MTLDEFRRHAEAWGGRLERWPAELQSPARAFAQRNEDARSILSGAKLLDDRLAFAADVFVARHRAQDAASKVLARIAEADEPRLLSWWGTVAGWLVPAGGVAVAAALGIALAVILAPPPLIGRETVLISAILDSGALAEDLVVE
jgi:hypothetical protein